MKKIGKASYCVCTFNTTFFLPYFLSSSARHPESLFVFIIAFASNILFPIEIDLIYPHIVKYFVLSKSKCLLKKIVAMIK